MPVWDIEDKFEVPVGSDEWAVLDELCQPRTYPDIIAVYPRQLRRMLSRYSRTEAVENILLAVEEAEQDDYEVIYFVR